jgi:hypothetical protein
MKELIRTNDTAQLCFLEVLLRDSNIESVIFDSCTSFAEGSIGALPRRLMVCDDDYDRACKMLLEAGHDPP